MLLKKNIYKMKKKIIKNSKVKTFYNEYLKNLVTVANNIDVRKLDKAVNLISSTIKKKKIYLCLWQRWISCNSKSLYL